MPRRSDGIMARKGHLWFFISLMVILDFLGGSRMAAEAVITKLALTFK
jgi:hypothetical protein